MLADNFKIVTIVVEISIFVKQISDFMKYMVYTGGTHKLCGITHPIHNFFCQISAKKLRNLAKNR